MLTTDCTGMLMKKSVITVEVPKNYSPRGFHMCGHMQRSGI